jgi:hypothetical protein
MTASAFAHADISQLQTTAIKQTPVAEQPPAVELIGSFQLQMQKAFWDNNSDNNLDDFFGRINFGCTFKAGDFQTLLLFKRSIL